MSRRSGQEGTFFIHGIWHCVKVWKDVGNGEPRMRQTIKICRVKGYPDHIKTESARRLKAKELIVASGVNNLEIVKRIIGEDHATTFREQTKVFLERKLTRANPVAPATPETWECALKNWIYPIIGDLPLSQINNFAMRDLVAVMKSGLVGGEKRKPLGSKSIINYTGIVKGVVASAIGDDGEQTYPRKWNHELIRMPKVNTGTQKTPSFTSETVTAIIRVTTDRLYRMFFILCAAAGLRFGEALGIDIRNISKDRRTIQLKQKAWKGKIHKFLKGGSADGNDKHREIDLHPSVAKFLDEYIGDRESGLLFPSRTGRQLGQSNILRRVLHPVLVTIEWKDAELGLTKAGAHAFRRFRNTYLANFTNTPVSLFQYWMGHASEYVERQALDGDNRMTRLYDKAKALKDFRLLKAEEAGLGFELPETLGEIPAKKVRVISKKALNGPNGPKFENAPVLTLSATA